MRSEEHEILSDRRAGAHIYGLPALDIAENSQDLPTGGDIGASPAAESAVLADMGSSVAMNGYTAAAGSSAMHTAR
jgi:hypothetical protein